MVLEQSLYDSGEIEETLEYLKEKGYTKEEQGALWFKATLFGAEKDSDVIVRNNGFLHIFLLILPITEISFKKKI